MISKSNQKIKVFTFFLLFFVINNVWANIAEIIGKPEFDPEFFTVGQTVTVYCELDPKNSAWTTEKKDFVLSKQADENFVTFLYISIENKSDHPIYIAKFIPWKKDNGIIPSITIGGLIIPEISYKAISAVEKFGDKNPNPFPQLNIPGFYNKVYFLVICFSLFLLILIFWKKSISPMILFLSNQLKLFLSKKEFKSLCKRLQKSQATKQDWAIFCFGLRKFISARAKQDLTIMTCSELENLPTTILPENCLEEFINILKTADKARFSGQKGFDFSLIISKAIILSDKIDDISKNKLKAKEKNNATV